MANSARISINYAELPRCIALIAGFKVRKQLAEGRKNGRVILYCPLELVDEIHRIKSDPHKNVSSGDFQHLLSVPELLFCSNGSRRDVENE